MRAPSRMRLWLTGFALAASLATSLVIVAPVGAAPAKSLVALCSAEGGTPGQSSDQFFELVACDLTESRVPANEKLLTGAQTVCLKAQHGVFNTAGGHGLEVWVCYWPASN